MPGNVESGKMKLASRLRFNLKYFGSPIWDTGVTPPEVLEFIASHPAGRALDIGCGTGTNVIALAEQGWEATGFDFAPRAIRLATQKANKAHIRATFFTDDACEMRHVRGMFDLVLDIGCFHGVQDKAGYLAQLERVLAPGGHWLVYGFLARESAQEAPGIHPAEVSMISRGALALVWQRSGLERHDQPSAWFLYRKKNST